MTRVLLLLAIAGLGSCTPELPKSEVYSVWYDTTDPLLATPETGALWNYIDGDDTSKDLVFRYSQLSGVDVNITRQFDRPAMESGLFSNAVQEKNRLDGFKQEFEAIINVPDSIGASHSAIFRPILSELEYLSGLPDSHHKELVVYSNLMENSDWMSFYSSRDLWLLQNKPDKIAERYLTQAKGDYKDVKLTIVYIPGDFKDNQRFKEIRGVYTQVFLKLNVPISFCGNLQGSNSSP